MIELSKAENNSFDVMKKVNEIRVENEEGPFQYPIKQERKTIKHLKNRQDQCRMSILDDMRKKIGFFSIYKLFEKYNLLIMEIKTLQDKIEELENH